MSRHDPALEAVARDTMSIVEAGGFRASDGSWVSLGPAIAKAVAGTRVYGSDELDALLDGATAPAGHRPPSRSGATHVIQVTCETTQEAAHRLAVDGELALLNFASATRAGGGFLQGAKAQEEDLARCSALYECLRTQTEHYALHRARDSPLYSDAMIYSPAVPFFRVRSESRLDRAYEASVITAAAPNATKAQRAGRVTPSELEAIFRRRTGKLLALAEARGQRTLVLGAWGCGVFGNDPVMAADAFATWLEAPRFRESFAHVVFAVFDPRPDKPTFEAFARRLAGA